MAHFLEVELPALCRDDVHGEAGYALPPTSLSVLVECVTRLQVQRVFEFGSGQSTREFLAVGCQVTAVEDDESWLTRTTATLDVSQRQRLVSLLLPLQRVWLAGAPLRSWRLPEPAIAALREAQLILVDSPAWPPFREHALTLALQYSRNALIVVDDANIPTVQRFCRRLASRNDLAHSYTRMDHGLFFLHSSDNGHVQTCRPPAETLKAWRRYFLERSAR